MAKKTAEYAVDTTIRRIIPLKAGWAYVTDLKGKLHHVRRDSFEFAVLVREIDESLNGKASKELKDLGLPLVSSDPEEAGES